MKSAEEKRVYQKDYREILKVKKEGLKYKYVLVYDDYCLRIVEKGTEDYKDVLLNRVWAWNFMLGMSDDLEELKQEGYNYLKFKVGSTVYFSNKSIPYQGNEVVSGTTRRDKYIVFSISFVQDEEQEELSLRMNIELSKNVLDFFAGNSFSVMFDCLDIIPESEFNNHTDLINERTEGKIKYDFVNEDYTYN